MNTSTRAGTMRMPFGTGMLDQPQEQFRVLIENHRGIVLKVAHTYCGHAEDRRDLAQEIAAQAWKGFRGYDPARPFSTWLYRIALNVAISHLRTSRGREPLAFDEIAEPAHDEDASREADDGMRALYRCIERLDPLNRALMLLYLDERNQREIAEILGLSETNVATKIARLKQHIRNDLAPAGT
jgi:RNA polymerase sigma-70 factor (ECF subfamily)